MRVTNVFGASAAFGLALGAAALVFPASARAADDDVSIDQKFMRSIMEGLGLKRDGEATINYRERSPLVHSAQSRSAAAGAERRSHRQQSGLAEGSRRGAPQGASGHGEGPQHQRRT